MGINELRSVHTSHLATSVRPLVHTPQTSSLHMAARTHARTSPLHFTWLLGCFNES